MTASPPQPASPARPARASAFLVGAGILLSRLTGLVRESVFAHYFGASAVAGAFRAAMRMPNFLQNLLGEGVLSASFIPVYSRLIADGETEMAGKVAGVVASLWILIVSAVVLLGVLFAPVLVDLVAPGFSGDVRALTVRLVQIMFPGVGLFVLSAWCLGILNSHRLFFISYVAPVLWNVAMITTLVAFGAGRSQASLGVILAWGFVVGAFCQFAVQLPFIWGRKTASGKSIGSSIRFGLQLGLEPVRQVFRSLGPVVVSRGVVQLSAFIDAFIASWLGAVAVAGLAYAQVLYTLPVSLFGMSVAAAELPEMSSATGTREEIYTKLRTRLVAGKRNIAFYVIPCVAGFLVLGRHFVGALFQTGHFGPQDTLYVWYILMGSTVGLLASTWGRLYSSAFYALRDTRTPLWFALIRVSLTAVLGYLFAFPLRPWLNHFLLQVLHLPKPNPHGMNIELGLGAVGLTFSAGLAGWVEFLLLRRALQKRIGSTALPNHYPSKIWAAALVACGAGWGVAHFVHLGFRWLNLAAILAAFGIIYAGLTLAAGLPEARTLLRLRR
ncbi:MAG TPA: murein biosynthesis integral membrane protein MurJ [Chthoniobacteraceae bacterium]|nr:murein biosynthesis integral membrane protein MurJ [Chthoniobacteraceae bacterium]